MKQRMIILMAAAFWVCRADVRIIGANIFFIMRPHPYLPALHTRSLVGLQAVRVLPVLFILGTVPIPVHIAGWVGTAWCLDTAPVPQCSTWEPQDDHVLLWFLQIFCSYILFFALLRSVCSKILWGPEKESSCALTIFF